MPVDRRGLHQIPAQSPKKWGQFLTQALGAAACSAARKPNVIPDISEYPA